MLLRNKIIVGVLFFVTLPLLGKQFPLCLYGVNNPADLQQIKDAGFSCIQTYQTDPAKLEPLAQKAQEVGLKVVFSPNKVLGTPYEQKAQKWPILAWYLVDEPDVKRWSREQVQEKHRAAKQAFPHHMTTLVIGRGNTRIPYYDIPDAMMVDWYPVPHLELTSFGEHVLYTKEGLAKTDMQDHPLWGVVQIFDWKNFKQHRPDNDRIGRFPTEEEIRFMSYDGILNGATGLFYFTFNHQGDILPNSAPQYWQRVQSVVRELARFKKIFEEGILVPNPVKVSKRLAMQTWQYQEALYSVLLNPTDSAKRLPKGLDAFEVLNGPEKGKYIAPYHVLLLKK